MSAKTWLDTSKFLSQSNVHGKHGDFLASLANLSLISVTSHHHLHVSHNSLIVRNGEVLSRNLPCPSELRFELFDSGTKVVVRDLFGSMPVRVKQRATAFKERANLDREFQRLVRDTVSLLLSWPNGVSVLLRDSVTQRSVQLKTSDKLEIVPRTVRLLSQASMAYSDDASSWIPVSGSTDTVSIRGCICLDPAASRRCQFLSFGIHSVLNEFGTNFLYEEINKVFKSSTFGSLESSNSASDRGNMDETGKGTAGLKIRKAVERWPMFYLRIELPRSVKISDLHDTLEPQGDLKDVLNLLKAVSYGFLKRHHFQPRKVQTAAEESRLSTARTAGRVTRYTKSLGNSNPRISAPKLASHSGLEAARSRSDSPFDGWSRVKIGFPSTFKGNDKGEPAGVGRARANQLVGEGGKLLRMPFEDATEQAAVNLDPSHGNSWKISRHCRESAKDVVVDYESQQTPRGSQSDDWLQDILRSWRNPVFETAQRAMPQTYDHGPMHESIQRIGDSSIDFPSASLNLSGRVSRAALAKAQVVCQVDRKFVLVKLPLGEGTSDANLEKSSALVMLDQHASDERCCLETLMEDYFKKDAATGQPKAIIEMLHRPLEYEISGRECEILAQYRQYFELWGIMVHVGLKGKQPSGRLTVTGLPPSILERCRTEPRLLIEMVRKEIWRLEEDGPARTQQREAAAEVPSAVNFHGCPPGILELLQSRSCRSKTAALSHISFC